MPTTRLAALWGCGDSECDPGPARAITSSAIAVMSAWLQPREESVARLFGRHRRSARITAILRSVGICWADFKDAFAVLATPGRPPADRGTPSLPTPGNYRGGRRGGREHMDDEGTSAGAGSAHRGT